METTASNDYHFITHWTVVGTAEEVYDLLSDAEALVRWWPSVYLRVQVLEPGNEQGIGRTIDLYTKGWLPYTLRWQFRLVEAERPHHLLLEAVGDFVGRGIWTFRQDGPWVDITYDWKIRAEKPLLRRLSFLLKPIFSANHHWAMQRGEESLLLELERQRTTNPGVWALIPAPPGPTPQWPFVAAGAALALAAVFVAARLLSRRRNE